MAPSLPSATGKPRAGSPNIVTSASKSGPIDASIGNRLREIRISSGLSRAQLAERLQIDAGEIGDYEGGKKRLNADLLLHIARVLGVRPDLFLRFSGQDRYDEHEDDEGAKKGADLYPTLVDQGLRLQRAFVRIGNASVRDSIVALVVELARSRRAP